MIHAREALTSLSPVMVEREVLWGECDPAGFVYTPRFADYAAGAAQYFSARILGPLADPETGHRLGLPMKALSFVFSRFLGPGDRFVMTVLVGHIGTTTFELKICATNSDGAGLFSATMRRICLDLENLAAVRLPGDARTILERYRAAYPGGDDI